MIHPPRLVQHLIKAALPPSRRETVLGDLEERFHSPGSGGTWRYLRDASQVVPRLMARHFLGGVSNWYCVSGSASLPSELHVRAAAYQDYIWNRNVHAVLAALIVVAAALISTLDRRWSAPDAGAIALAIGWICATYQLYFRRGHASLIPLGISPAELRNFHRVELRRQMSLNLRLQLYWILPAPLFLIAYGMTIGPLKVMLSGLILLGAILLQALVIAPFRRRERVTIERELARLETESVESAS